MNVLVVGGAGFVGSHMTNHLLTRNHVVTVFDNLSRGHRDAILSASMHEGDLLSASDLKTVFDAGRFDVVMHFAALCYVGESVTKPREYYRNNLTGTLNLLGAMQDAGVNNLVFSSTCSTYGDPIEIPMRETHPQNPINPYGASKLMVERVLKDYAVAYGLNSVALRYFNAAGSDPAGKIGERHDPETHIIPLALLEALRVRAGGDPASTSLVVFGNDYDTPDGTCIRDYVHVDDLAAAHLAAAQGMAEGKMNGARAYNLGMERGFSVLEVIESCRRVTGVAIQFRIGPRRAGDPARLVANSDAARRDLAWRPSYVELDRIVETAWRWYSSHPHGS
jgi:UDP-glucose-4-epimerase GalE